MYFLDFRCFLLFLDFFLKKYQNMGQKLGSNIVFIEKVTYNLINLKYHNSLNIGHNANPTFSLMNNQSQSSDNIRSFILDAKSRVCSSFFFYGIDF
jgi:hypothetical protein